MSRDEVDLGRFGRVVRQLREARGLTIEELGEALGGVHRNTVGAWERGQSMPAPENLDALASAFHVKRTVLEQAMRPKSALPDESVSLELAALELAGRLVEEAEALRRAATTRGALGALASTEDASGGGGPDEQTGDG